MQRQRIPAYQPERVFDFTSSAAAEASAAPARRQLVEEGILVSKVFTTSEMIGMSEKYAALCERQNGTARGAGSMNGLTKLYGTASDPLVMEGRLSEGPRMLYASLYDLPPADPDQPQETIVSIDAVCLSDGSTANFAKPFTGRIDSKAGYRNASGSGLPAHIDANPFSDIISHGNKTDAAIAELVQAGDGVPFTAQTFVCTHDVCEGGAAFTFFTDPDDTHPAPPPDEAYFEKTTGDFCHLTDEGHKKFSSVRRVELKAGWAVTWISRSTIHSNQAPYGDARDKKRYGFYVCRIPAGIMSAEERAKNTQAKMELAAVGRTTDHWPNSLKSYGGAHYSNKGGKTRVLYGPSKGENHGSPQYRPATLALMRKAL